MKSHLQSYPCPLQINFFWNIGFLLGVAILLQIVTGIFLALHYTSDIGSAYYSIFFLIREVNGGYIMRYFHSSGASFVFCFLFLHIGRSIFYGSYFYNPNTWNSGILILFLLMAIAFMGYVLPFGQMSFWGATVITNLLSPFPSLIEWICGGYCVHSPTLKRFFVFHFILPFILCGFIVIHIFYLHYHSSNNPLRLNTNNKIPFFPFIFIKDFFGLIVILSLYMLQINFGVSSLSHPDNALEACALLTPLHIVPEWYFLCQYAMLKAVPNKNAGFIILLTSIFVLFLFSEIRNLTTFIRLIECNNGFSISCFFLLFIIFLWIGAQFPQEKFLSYARILTLYYYFIIMCILFSIYSFHARAPIISLS
jgi:ubiquinol-cytochrome c reductase cytochrome b subunit